MLTTNIPAPPPTSLVSLLPTSVSSSLSQTEGKGGDRESTIKPVGTVRLTPRLGKVSRLAVDKEFRQYGYGKVIMQSLERYVRESKGEVLDEFKPVTREEDGKTIVRLKLHSQVNWNALGNALGGAHGRCKSCRFTRGTAMCQKDQSSTRKGVSIRSQTYVCH